MTQPINHIRTKDFYKSQRIEILSNRLFISKKTWFKYLEFELPFDEIILHKTVTKDLNRDLIALGFFIFGFGIIINMAGGTFMFAILTIVSLIFTLIGLFTKRGKIIINNYSKEPVILDFKNRNEIQIRSFSDRIIEKAKEYLVNKHSRIDKDLPLENQLDSIAFLRNNDLIDETKFIELKNSLIGIDKNKKSIGFEQ